MTATPSPSADRAELVRALAVLCERPGPSHPAVAGALGLDPAPSAVDYTEVFVHQLPPYASIYLDVQGKIGGEARDRIAGFWRAVGLTPPVEPDHLAALLGLWAGLTDAADLDDGPRRVLVVHSQHALVWEHLVSWLIPYLIRVTEIAPEPYRGWSSLVSDTVTGALGTSPAGDRLPIHLVEEPPWPKGADQLVAHLLTPARSGMVLTRADLHRAAVELGLGIRIGERAYALESLLAQDPNSVLTWLGTEAERQSDSIARSAGPPTIVAVWAHRATRTASLLAERVARPLEAAPWTRSVP